MSFYLLRSTSIRSLLRRMAMDLDGLAIQDIPIAKMIDYA